jgi:hypothetical protein
VETSFCFRHCCESKKTSKTDACGKEEEEHHYFSTYASVSGVFLLSQQWRKQKDVTTSFSFLDVFLLSEQWWKQKDATTSFSNPPGVLRF